MPSGGRCLQPSAERETSSDAGEEFDSRSFGKATLGLLRALAALWEGARAMIPIHIDETREPVPELVPSGSDFVASGAAVG